MAILTASGLGVSYGAHDVFADLGFSIPHGARIALVGPNGSGKSSLVKVLAGVDEPSAGSVHVAKGARIGYLAQHPEITHGRSLRETLLDTFSELMAMEASLRELEERMAASPPAGADVQSGGDPVERYSGLQARFEAAGGYTYASRVERVARALGFTGPDMDRPIASMSGGEVTRAMLGRLLLAEPDLLIMDEPTNHLDLAAVEWLENELTTWRGAVLVVAHDRAFLDAVAKETWELEGGRLESYPGGYTKYAALRAVRREERLEAWKRQRAEIERTQDYIRRNIAGVNTRQAQGRRTRLARLERLDKPGERRGPGLRLVSERRRGDRALAITNLVVGYPDAPPLATTGELKLGWGECVALLGPNGAGKTTFLRTLLGQLHPRGGAVRLADMARMGYLSQAHEMLRPDQTVLEHIRGAGLLNAPARQLLGRYGFSGDDATKPVSVLSGGERARVALALLELEGANLLLLDEPTNHLDIHSQEILQELLADFPGAMILVTHDRFLIRALGGKVWAIEDGRVAEYEDGYDAYRAAQSGAQASAEHGVGGHRARPEERRRAKGDPDGRSPAAVRRLREAAESLEADLQAASTRLADIEVEIGAASAAQDLETIARLGDEHSRLTVAVTSLEEEWLAAVERVEAADGQ